MGLNEQLVFKDPTNLLSAQNHPFDTPREGTPPYFFSFRCVGVAQDLGNLSLRPSKKKASNKKKNPNKNMNQ